MRIDFIFFVCAFKDATFPLAITYIYSNTYTFQYLLPSAQPSIYLPRKETSKAVQKVTSTPNIHVSMEDKVIHPTAWLL